jgi:hypothetical protein
MRVWSGQTELVENARDQMIEDVVDRGGVVVELGTAV